MTKFKKIKQFFPYTYVLFPLFVGLSIALSWIFEFEQFIIIRKSWAPMQFNTAVTFVLISIALILFKRQKASKLIDALGCMVILIGTIVVSEFIFDYTTFDTLFLDPFIISIPGYPGRMALNTAVSFILTGIGTIFLNKRLSRYHKVSLILGIIVFYISLITQVGYLFNFPLLKSWGTSIPMAVRSSISFIFLSLFMIENSRIFNKPTIMNEKSLLELKHLTDKL